MEVSQDTVEGLMRQEHDAMTSASLPTAFECEIPWGEATRLRLQPPGDWSVADVFQPDLSGAVADYPASLREALDAPWGGQGIESVIGAGASVAIVVDDPSRWTPVRAALPVVLDRLEALGVTRSAITISFGVGRHHAVTEAAMAERLGPEVAASYRCFSPPVDDLSAYDDLGATQDGVPVRVFAPVARADLRIMVGSVLPHMQAGFGGRLQADLPGDQPPVDPGSLAPARPGG